MTPKGEWVWSKTYQEQARVIEEIDLWGSSHYRIWLPNRDAVVLVPDSDIQGQSSADNKSEGFPHPLHPDGGQISQSPDRRYPSGAH